MSAEEGMCRFCGRSLPIRDACLPPHADGDATCRGSGLIPVAPVIERRLSQLTQAVVALEQAAVGVEELDDLRARVHALEANDLPDVPRFAEATTPAERAGPVDGLIRRLRRIRGLGASDAAWAELAGLLFDAEDALLEGMAASRAREGDDDFFEPPAPTRAPRLDADGIDLPSSVSVNAIVGIWTELDDAYHGRHGFGGSVAEIYAYRLMPRDPRAENGSETARGELAAAASAAMEAILVAYARLREVRIIVDRVAVFTPARRASLQPEDRRWHIEVRR